MSAGYRLKVEPIEGKVAARRNGDVIAATRGARLMRETRLPDSVYLPREALQGVALTRSDLRTFCPFKGTATYWHGEIGGEVVENAFWSYESALPEAEGVQGMLGMTPALGADLAFENAAPAPSDDGHISSPLADWVMREAAHCPDGAELTRQIAERFLAAGIAVRRLGVLLYSLHPEIAGRHYVWRRDTGAVEVNEAHHADLERADFANSPLRFVSAGLGGVRQPLDGRAPEFDFAILDELRAEGATDYVAMPLFFSDGGVNVLTMASDHPKGFTTANLGLVFECSGALSRFYEVLTLRENAASLLGAYVGRKAGARVLNGEIRRGSGDDIEAAILFCDLIGSTRLSGALERQEYLGLLNGFFETVSRAVETEGGEVLKFIGDAVLAIFPAEEAGAAARATAAARAIPGAVAAVDGRLRCAVGLSYGPVTYGNVGAPSRLDFTVIGTAAAVAARLSDLAKTERRVALATAEFADDRAIALGAYELRNVEAPVEVVAL